ncbi:Pleckstrin homology domain-containing family G member 5 [Eumeta japonica]|uniref:Pleckstrin homology domain-containing family G member 5 n=1 Tax=Eumeta variegata TaxID=151549 RepID=A0A4C2AH03_EUMVA|nr:Pleckstrin homology domain-containing family G member 5 [Eumeta japonica]
MATAHALQDGGMLLEIDTEKLFSNTPDVLNASLYFWEAAIYPMLCDAIENDIPLNTEYMYPGFYRFRELFQPYEKYVSEQSKALDYLRSLTSNTDFMAYLTWCHSHKDAIDALCNFKITEDSCINIRLSTLRVAKAFRSGPRKRCIIAKMLPVEVVAKENKFLLDEDGQFH